MDNRSTRHMFSFPSLLITEVYKYWLAVNLYATDTLCAIQTHDLVLSENHALVFAANYCSLNRTPLQKQWMDSAGATVEICL